MNNSGSPLLWSIGLIFGLAAGTRPSQAQIVLPLTHGDWSPVYVLQDAGQTVQLHEEFAHASVLPDENGHVLLWNLPKCTNPSTVAQPHTYLWKARVPSRIDLILVPTVADQKIGLKGCGTAQLGNGDLLTGGGDDFFQQCAGNQDFGHEWSFRYDWQLEDLVRGSRFTGTTEQALA